MLITTEKVSKFDLPVVRSFHISHGAKVIIKGRAVPAPPLQRYSVNLCQQTDLEPFTAVHFSVEFDDKTIVLNHMQDGRWGKEEKYPNHVVVGQEHEITVTCLHDKVQIECGGKAFEYKFKTDDVKEKVRYLVIKDCLQISELTTKQPTEDADKPAK